VYDNSAAPGGGTVSRGATNLVGPTEGLCGLPTRQGFGPDQLPCTDREKYTDVKGSDQQPRTDGNSRPRHTGVDKAAGNFRLGPTVYELCSDRLKDSSVTSATVQRAFIVGGGIPPFGSVTAGHDTSATPEVGTMSRGATNLVGLAAGLCGLHTPQGTGPDQLKRTDREKYYARRPKPPLTTHRSK
jgi:hypothetical protein